MTVSTKSLVLIVMLAALVASAFTYATMSLAQPRAATASDRQIVNAIKNAVGTSQFDGNSLRNDLRKMIGTSEHSASSLRNDLKEFIGAGNFEGLRGEVHRMCRALAENPIDC
jgi:hypothetical protein